MPRPAVGQAARSEIVSVRLTKQEVESLARTYGSAGKGLRALLASFKGRPTAYPRERK
jgi:hypothetical protein